MFQCNDKHSFRLPAYFSNRLHCGKVGLCIPGSPTFYFPTKIRFQFIHSDIGGGGGGGGGSWQFYFSDRYIKNKEN